MTVLGLVVWRVSRTAEVKEVWMVARKVFQSVSGMASRLVAWMVAG